MSDQIISQLLHETGSTLLAEKNPQTVSGIVRELQAKIKENETPSSQSLIFLLNLILDDIFYNISGDNGYNDSMYTSRDIIFSQIGRTLIVISEKMSIVDDGSIYSSLCELTNTYLDALKSLNNQYLQEKSHATK